MGRPRKHDTDLPENMYLRRGTYFWRVPETGKWINLGKDAAKAAVKVLEMHAQPLDMTAIPLDGPERFNFAMFAERAYRKCRAGAIQRGIPWLLSQQDVLDVLVRSGGRCEVSGISFSNERVGKRGLRPWMPSIDRMDAAGVYESGNVRVVCFVANLALSDFGDEVLRRLAAAIVRHPISSKVADTAATGVQ